LVGNTVVRQDFLLFQRMGFTPFARAVNNYAYISD